MATTNYPGSLDSYPVPNSGDNITVADHWLGPAVIGIETELGTDPAGSFTDVKSRLDSGLVTQADVWRLTATLYGGGDTLISSNLERADDTSSGLLGTGMSVSSGVWTFPETGIYEITFIGFFTIGSNLPDNVEVKLEITTDNSTYDRVSLTSSSDTSGSGGQHSGSMVALVDVTDTSNVKAKFTQMSANTGNGLFGSSNYNATTFSFVRLGGT